MSRPLPLLAATLAALMALTACASGSDRPQSTSASPSASVSSSASTSATEPAAASGPEQQLLATVTSLQGISSDFNNAWGLLADQYVGGVTSGRTVKGRRESYRTARAAFLDTIAGVETQTRSADPELLAAADEFVGDARGAVGNTTELIAFDLSRTVCTAAVLTDPFAAESDPSGIKDCRRQLAALQDSAVPEIVTYARAFADVMDEQARLYGALDENGPGCDSVCYSGRFAAAVKESVGNYRKTKPTIAAVEPAIVERQRTTTVAQSYPALLGLVQAQADQVG